MQLTREPKTRSVYWLRENEKHTQRRGELMKTRKPLVVAIATVATGAIWPQLGIAGGYALNEQGAHASGTANAGAAANPENAGILFFNPAGMTKLKGTQLSFGASVIEVDPEFSGTATNNVGAPVIGDDGGDFIGTSVIPNLYLTHTWDRFATGIGIYVPYGLKANYDNDFVGRYFADKTEVQVITIQPSFAFELTEQLSLGFGLNAQYAEGRITKWVDYSDQSPLLPDGYFDTEGDDLEFGWTAGVLFSPTESTNIGLTYRSETDLELEGEAELTGPFGALVGATPGQFVKLKEDAVVPLPTPETATIALKHDFNEQWTLLAGATWTRWSRFENLDIWSDQGGGVLTNFVTGPKYGAVGSIIGHVPENWENTWSAAVGAAYHLSPQWTLRAGYAWDESPVKEEFRTARVPSSDRHWLTLGAGWKEPESGWMVDTAFGYLIIDDIEVDENEFRVGESAPFGNANLDAKYEIDAWGVALQVSKGF